MERHAYTIIGLDVKPRRTTHIRRNRFKPTYPRWLFPAVMVLASLGIIVAVMR